MTTIPRIEQERLASDRTDLPRLRDATMLSLSEAQRTAAALADVGRLVSETLDVHVAGQRIAESLRTLLGARHAVLFRLEPGSEDLVTVALGGEAIASFGPGLVFPRGTGVVGLAVRERGAIVTTNWLTDHRIVLTPDLRARLAETPYGAVLAVPLLVRDRVIGALGVGDREGRVFDEDDIRLTSTFACQAALALESAQLYAEIARRGREAENRLARLRTLTRLTRLVSTSLDMDETLREIARAGAQIAGATVVAFWLADERTQTLEVRAFSNEAMSADFPVRQLGFDQGVVGWIATHRESINIPNVFTDGRLVCAEWWRTHGLTSFLGIPVGLEGALLAVLACNGRAPFDLDADDREIFDSFVAQAAVAIRKARAYEEATRRRRESDVVAEIARDLNASHDLHPVLQRIAEGAQELCGADSALIALRDPESGAMVFTHGLGIHPERYRALRVESGKGAGGLVLSSGRPFRTDHYADDPHITKDYLAAVADDGVVAQLVVPIRGDRGIEGLLYVNNRSPRPFTERDETLLLRLADHAAITIGNVQSLARERAARAETEASEQRFRDLVQTLDAIVWESHPPAETVARHHANPRPFAFVSQRAEDILGYPVDRWLADPEFWTQLIHPGDRDRVLMACRTGLAEGTGEELDYRVIAADGRIVWLRDVVRVSRDAEGRVQRQRGLMIDITARKLTEEALRQSEARFHRLTQLAPVGIFRTDPQGHYVYVNERCCVLTGLTPDEARGEGWVRGLHPDDRERVVAEWGRAARASRPFESEYRFRRPDGTVAWVFGQALAEHGPAGDVRGYVGTVTDITARKLAEEALRESEARYRGFVEGSIQGIFIQEDFIIRLANPALARMFGYASPDELIGRNLGMLIAPHELPRLQAYAAARLRGENPPARYEFQGVRKDGSVIWIENMVSLIPWNGARAFLATQVDITERKQAERVLQDTEAQLRQAQKMEAIGRLAGGVAHDFNNLLTILRGRCELLLNHLNPDHPLYRHARSIRDAGDRAGTLTRQLLAFSRKQVLEPRVLDLNAVVDGLAKMLPRLIGEDIALRLVPGANLHRVRADQGQLEQVIMNLAVNARDAMADGGQLIIETTNVVLDETFTTRHADLHRGRSVMLAVSDTGCGMPPDIQARIFEPFFTTKGPDTGTGLGLATVYGIVKQSDGEILVYSEVGRGTTFKIYLPAVDDPVDPAPPTPSAVQSSGGSETILLVEDDDEVRALTREVLQSNGYHALEARHPGEALLIGERFPGAIDLLLTDVVMPQMNGCELADRLRTLRPPMKVLYMSGYTGTAIVRHGVLDSDRAFLGKPFMPDSLLAKLREVLDAPALAGP
jgi:PAS domain S-box-containing protein